ncbi:MAG: protein kinase [Acidobacteriota bacterium]|nr:protein kinase [Acidobacteriota bacterium]
MNDKFVGQTLANKYRVDSELRQSGSGKIYRGTHLLMDTPVTVKILAPALAADENIVRDFSGEARTVSRISHPNILNVTDFGSDINGTVYIVSEGASGETLKEAIRRESKFSLNRAVRIAWQIASALSAAHAAGVVHHRLNAENILLAQTANDSETVKILGFGAAQTHNQTAFDHETDLKDLEYLSPEQNASVSDTDERSDVYALGVIFYEMLAGEVPFTAENPTALMLKQAENPPPPLSSFRRDLPEAVELVVLKALAKNPEMRYQSANEFVNALNQASNNVGGAETIIIPNAANLPDTATNNLWKTAFVVLAGISLLAIGMIYATSVKQTEVPTAMQTDANGQPVQPLNPATGMTEYGLANMASSQMPQMGNFNGETMMLPPQLPSGGDGYGDGQNFWSGEGPPRGAPPSAYVGPGGQIITIPGEGGSQFMPNENGIYYIPVPVPANTNANVQPSPTPKGGKTTAAPAANTQPTPNAQTPAETKPTPAPKIEKPPATKPAPSPKTAPPASSEKNPPSGTEKDTQ